MRSRLTTAPSERWVDEDGRIIDVDDLGPAHDAETLQRRRRALGLFGVFAASTSPDTAPGTSGGTGTSTPVPARSSGSVPLGRPTVVRQRRRAG